MSDTEADKKSAGKIKPFLLSFALFPGLGQLSQGKKVLGFSIIAVVSICTYILLGEAFSQINEAAQRMVNEGSADAYRVQQEAHEIVKNLSTGKFMFALYTLVIAWLFSAAEVFRGKRD